ncbi:MAG: succinylglutamate desuccinylase/aspartoacylase family protein [Acidobacteriota bacterium]
MGKAAAEALVIAGRKIPPGRSRSLSVAVTESYSGGKVVLPVRVERAVQPGPVVLVVGAVHGDEINGTGIVRRLILHRPFELAAGSLVLVPVVNILGFERLSRYLPDRRDLNRYFPGSRSGSLASRFARKVFDQLIAPCDFCLDFHSAAVRRTNFPNIRADLSQPAVRRLAQAVGWPVTVDTKGPAGTLRRAACAADVPTVTLEAGEVWKIEPGIVELGVRAVRNVLIDLGMVEGEPEKPAYRAEAEKTEWLRSDEGGMLTFHTAPGDVLRKGQPVAAVTNLIGEEKSVMAAPKGAVVLGLTTLPAVKPGDPVCHLAYPRGGIARIRRVLNRLPEESLHQRVRDDLAANVAVTEPEAGDWQGSLRKVKTRKRKAPSKGRAPRTKPVKAKAPAKKPSKTKPSAT